MHLGFAHDAIRKPNPSKTFEFSPAAFAIELTQARNVTNRTAYGDGLDIGDFADYLHVYGADRQ